MFYSIITLIHIIQGKESPTQNISNEIDPFEESVVNAMLRIVDEKFDSLSTRMTSMERALTSLQYYNLRQFRTVNTHLHALDTLLQSIHGRVGQQDLNSKEMATSVSLLKREIKNMELLNNNAFGNIEISLENVNKDVAAKFEAVQSSIEIAINNTGTGSGIRTDKLSTSDSSNEHSVCLNVVSRVEEKVDNLSNFTLRAFENLTSELTREDGNRTEKRMLMRSLIEVNDNVQQSIAFYRHTGDLVGECKHFLAS